MVAVPEQKCYAIMVSHSSVDQSLSASGLDVIRVSGCLLESDYLTSAGRTRYRLVSLPCNAPCAGELVRQLAASLDKAAEGPDTVTVVLAHDLHSIEPPSM